MEDFPGNRHSETEKIQHFTKDVNFLKKWIAGIEDRHGYKVFGETIFESCHYYNHYY